MKNYSILIIFLVLTVACGNRKQVHKNGLRPEVITEPVRYDTDDPAIWINKENPSKSLIIGTDKNANGALYVFDLEGKIQQNLVVEDLKRPNNVDVEYGLKVGDKEVDIAVTGERLSHNMRVFSLPDMKPIDGGGIPVFKGETEEEYRDLMGVALYKDPANGTIYAIMGRKTGPTNGTYLWQYKLIGKNDGTVTAQLVRKFANFSGVKEIEAIAVDDELGYVYCSDESVGVRKYYADPEKGNEELALFAKDGFAHDHEGISIYDTGNGKGYILVSDQQANEFKVYPREGSSQGIHDHPMIKSVALSTSESDGSEITNVPLNARFPNGVFVAMSDNKTFQFYRVEDILGLKY